MTAAKRRLAAPVLALTAAGAAPTSPLGAQAPAGAQPAVSAALAKFRTLNEGKNADSIAISTALGGNPCATKPRS